LQNCCIEADTYVCINKANTKTNEPGIIEKYNAAFGDFLIPGSIPDIKSLKRLTENVNYPLHQAVKNRLEQYIDFFIKGDTSCLN